MIGGSTRMIGLVCVVFVAGPVQVARAQATNGPLQVHPRNPRYFADASGRVVYLTGSHIWNNFMDWGRSYPPSLLNHTAFLDFLAAHHHNFIRGWVWETTTLVDYSPDVYFHPDVYQRTDGSQGNANDGRPKFDLTRVNTAYLNRLRDRVIEARDRGIYYGVMLFQPINYGNKKSDPPDNQMAWWTHPYQRNNNVNGIDGDPNGDGEGWETSSLPTDTHYSPRISQAVTNLQEAYVRAVIDHLNDLDNVIWEIGNEGNFQSYNWQVHFIDFIRSYEQQQGYMRHPVWLTAMVGTASENDQVNGRLFASSAEVISPNNRNGYPTDPPANAGTKVIIIDTDHTCGVCQSTTDATTAWAWKCFTRGHQVAFMDSYYNDNPWGTNKAHHNALRHAMGDTRRYAERMNLAAATPQNALSSTAHCLAKPGVEYLVYQPGSGPFTVNLVAGTYDYEWFNPNTRVVIESGSLTAADGVRTFTPPFSGDAVLFLGDFDTPPELIEDTFTIVSPDRDPGDPLDGTVAEVGEVTWSATPDAVFVSGGLITNTAGTQPRGSVPVDPSAYYGRTVAVEADVNLAGGLGDAWLSIGFMSGPGTVWVDGEVWMLVRRDGRYTVFADGTAHQLAGDALPVHEDDLKTAYLLYEPAKRTVSAWLNGVPILAGFDLDSLAFTPAISRAGFTSHRVDGLPAEAMEVDNFAVRTGVDGPPPLPGDFDHDGDVDISDFGYLQRCYSGSTQPLVAGCESADLNGSLTVDQDDAAIFINCIGGSGMPPGC